MAVTWDIKEIRVDVNQGVNYVHYYAWDEEVQGEGYDSRAHTGFYDAFVEFNPDPSADGYTNFSNLSKAQVIGWVKDSIGSDMVTTIEDAIASQIQRSKGTLTEVEFPWTEV